MRQESKDELQTALVALLIGSLLLGLFVLLDSGGLHWRPWLDLIVVTGTTFTYLASILRRELRRPTHLALFVMIITLHVGVFVRLLQSGMQIPIWYYLPVMLAEYVVVAGLFRWLSNK